MPGGPEGRGYVLYEDGSTGTTGPGYTIGPVSVRTIANANAGPSGPIGTAGPTMITGPTK